MTDTEKILHILREFIADVSGITFLLILGYLGRRFVGTYAEIIGCVTGIAVGRYLAFRQFDKTYGYPGDPTNKDDKY